MRNHGEMYLPYAVLLGGLTCIAFALLRCANLLVLISSSVMIGFVNGLAIIISLSQVSQFKANLLDGIPGREADAAVAAAAAPAPTTGGARRLHGAIDVFTDGEPWLGWDVAQWMLLEVIVVVVAMVSFPKLAGYDKFAWTKNIPPSLVGIMLATAVEWGIVRPAGYVAHPPPTTAWSRGPRKAFSMTTWVRVRVAPGFKLGLGLGPSP